MAAITHAPMHVMRRMDVKAAAAYLGISVSKMNKVRTYGGGPRYLKLTKRVVYDVHDLDAWASEFYQANTSQNSAA